MITVTRKDMKSGMIIRSLKSGKFMIVGKGKNGRVVLHMHDFKPISPAHDEWELVGVNAKLNMGWPWLSAVGK